MCNKSLYVQSLNVVLRLTEMHRRLPAVESNSEECINLE